MSAEDQTLVTQIEAVVQTLFDEKQQAQAWFDTANPQLGNSTPRALMQQPDSIKRLHTYVIGVAETEVKSRWQEIQGLLAKSELTSGELWKVKQLQQKNDRVLIATGKLIVEDVFFIKPEKMKGVKVRWPDGDDQP